MKNHAWRWGVLSIFLLIILAFPLTAGADMGPKPTLTIVVQHPPEEPYYLDLLIAKKGDFDNLENRRDQYDAHMLSLLRSREDEGWYPALTGGTVSVPLFGKLTGEKDGDTMRHTFSYYGVPDTFKVIIVTADDRVVVSQEVHTKAFYAVVTCDYASASAAVQPPDPTDPNVTLSAAEQTPEQPDPSFADYHPDWWLDTLRQFVFSCLPTLLLEGVVLLLFRFSLRQNAALILLTNVGTQLLLTAASSAAYLLAGMQAGYWAVLAAEGIVFLTETLLYARWLNGHTRGRRVAYALTANAVSLFAGLFSLAAVWL